MISPKISVIVPVYNVEQYIAKCIESILAQKFTDFELLLIDDGSLDNSGVICDEYAKNDERIHVFHKENSGASFARNLGLKEARGEWITFIDSDDTITENYLDCLNNSIKDKDQFIMQGLNSIYSSGYINKCNFPDALIPKSKFSDLFNKYKIYRFGFSVAKFYNNNIIKKNSLHFNENLPYKEDLLFMLEYLNFIENVRFSSGVGYNYYIRENSLSTKIHDYLQEYNCFFAFRKIIKKNKINIYFSYSTLDDLKKIDSTQLYRVLLSIYQPANKYNYGDSYYKMKRLIANNKHLLLYNSDNYQTFFLMLCRLFIKMQSYILLHNVLYIRFKIYKHKTV